MNVPLVAISVAMAISVEIAISVEMLLMSLAVKEHGYRERRGAIDKIGSVIIRHHKRDGARAQLELELSRTVSSHLEAASHCPRRRCGMEGGRSSAAARWRLHVAVAARGFGFAKGRTHAERHMLVCPLSHRMQRKEVGRVLGPRLRHVSQQKLCEALPSIFQLSGRRRSAFGRSAFS